MILEVFSNMNLNYLGKRTLDRNLNVNMISKFQFQLVTFDNLMIILYNSSLKLKVKYELQKNY